MDKVKLSEMNLAAFRQLIDSVSLPGLLDAQDTETCMTKTETGYVYEIRYKQPGKHFLADAITITDVYKNLKDFITLDEIALQMKGWAHHVGRLADLLEAKK